MPYIVDGGGPLNDHSCPVDGGIVILEETTLIRIEMLHHQEEGDDHQEEEKPLPQTAPGLIGILGAIVIIGLIVGVVFTVFMVYRRQQKPPAETDNDLTDLPPAHKPAPPPPKKKKNDTKSHLTSEEIQVVHLEKEEEGMQQVPPQPPYYMESAPYSDKMNLAKHREELPNTADYISYRLACNKEDYLEPHSPPVYPPLTYLPHNPYIQNPTNSPVFRYPPLGSLTSYTFPKEQYV